MHVYYRREGETLHFDTVVDKHDKNGNFFFSHSPIKKDFYTNERTQKKIKGRTRISSPGCRGCCCTLSSVSICYSNKHTNTQASTPKNGGSTFCGSRGRIPPSLSTRVRSGEKTTIVSEKLLTNEISCVWRLEIPLRRVFPWKEKKKKEGDQQFPSQNFFCFFFFLPWSNRQWFRPCV